MTIRETEYFKKEILPYWNKERSWDEFEKTLERVITIEYDNGETIRIDKGNLNDMLAVEKEYIFENSSISKIEEVK